jgi:hypothetical protein
LTNRPRRIAPIIVVIKKAKRTSQRIYLSILGVRLSFLIRESISFSINSPVLIVASLLLDEPSSNSLRFKPTISLSSSNALLGLLAELLSSESMTNSIIFELSFLNYPVYRTSEII